MTQMFGLLEKLRGRKTETTLDYAALVQDTLNGVDHDESEAADILQQAGKTVEDFEADLEYRRQRKLWHDQWQAGEAGQQASRDASIEKERLLKEREQKLAEIESHYFAAISKCDGLMADASVVMGTGHLALRKLQQTVPPELLAEEKAQAERLRAIQENAERCRETCQRLRGNVSTLERQLEKSPRGPARDRYETELEGARRLFLEAQENWEYVEERRRELNAEMNRIQAAKLIP
jgi:predicted RNase H-like nuclease (RuvC/YqgF family)